jgi:FKBP-type peptidyl-prolyl cis-trans isomerase SlyD
MSITQDQVVSIHYTLKDDAGEIIDTSEQGSPLTYLHGHGNLIPGLERELTGKNAGDRLQVQIAPRDGYGEYDSALVQRVPRRALQGVPEVKVGMRLQMRGGGGPRAVTVTQVLGDMVTLDGNHRRGARGDRGRALARTRARAGWAPPLTRALRRGSCVAFSPMAALPTGRTALASHRRA